MAASITGASSRGSPSSVFKYAVRYSPSAVRSKRTAVPPAMIGAFFDKLYKSLKQDVDYDALAREEKSFAGEAAEYALAGTVPTTSKAGFEVATFAGGCFWGTELHFQRIPGVIATCVGYTQGGLERPSYEQVCSGTTGHTEGLQLSFDPAVVSYEALCDKLLAVVRRASARTTGRGAGAKPPGRAAAGHAGRSFTRRGVGARG